MKFFIPFTAFLLLSAITFPQELSVPNQKLADHGKDFVREVVEVTDGVHVALNFGLPNSILIVGDGGNIIVDTMESMRAAQEVKTAFDAISSQPVAAIVYTHNHYDHVNGASVFAGNDKPMIIAHESLDAEMQHRDQKVQAAIFTRSMRQFGIPLPPKDYLNAGIGPRLNLGIPGETGYLTPTRTFDESIEVEIAGIKLKLVHAPGETDDQIYVYLPDKKVLLPGDNIYKAFPNLYAIRGTKLRNVEGWVNSLDKMIAEDAEYLIPSHTAPVEGADMIKALLSDYRDAIDFVLQETLKGMNSGETPDELAAHITLPEKYKNHAYLQEFYGTVPWSVRSIYMGYLGWFDGNATNLFPLPPKDRAERMIKLAGGQEALLQKVEEALNAEDWQWASELVDNILTLEKYHDQGRKYKAKAMYELSKLQTSANARNYYLTTALQLGGY